MPGLGQKTTDFCLAKKDLENLATHRNEQWIEAKRADQQKQGKSRIKLSQPHGWRVQTRD